MIRGERLNEIKVVSFDVEGTLVTTEFSYAIWFEAIPESYAERHGIPVEQAKKVVMEEFQKVGDQRVEWYDIQYWFDKLDLGNFEPVMEKCQSRVNYYPEVVDMLEFLSGKYKLIVASGSPREFLRYLLRDIEPYFDRIFSSISDYKQLKISDFYHKMCRELNVRPEHVIHIGDNWQFDFAAANETGIHAFYLDRMRQTDHQDSLPSLVPLKAYLLD